MPLIRGLMLSSCKECEPDFSFETISSVTSLYAPATVSAKATGMESVEVFDSGIGQ
ncbi:hypothetical protein Mapa_003737 [Marchantia paleacea]|nr:hypothetical protein Mapa_003737 [Marchantia paleacea]